MNPEAAGAGGGVGGRWGFDPAWWAALAVLCGMLVVPLLVAEVPPLGDYPNHLARAFVLASLPQDPVLGRFYAAHWTVIPNLALDLIAVPLLHVLPVHVVGRVVIALAVLLPVLGAVTYNWMLGGRWWGLGAGLAAYDGCLLYGFLNFQISLGVALLLAAAWLAWREARPVRAIGLAVVGAPVLFACHLMGLVFLAVLIGGAELFRLSAEGSVVSWIRRGGVLALVFAAPAGLYAVSMLHQLDDDAVYLPLGRKLAQLTTDFVNYDRGLDLATSAVAFGIPGCCLLARLAPVRVRRLWHQGAWGRMPGVAGVPVLVLVLLFLVAPYAWKGTFRLDTRLAAMLGLMLFAGFVPGRWPGWVRIGVAGGLVLLFCIRIAVLSTAWAAQRGDVAALRWVLAAVQPGQAVYVAEAGLDEAQAYWAASGHWRLLSDGTRVDEHLGALVLIERRAWWPFEFDNESQQPLRTREPYAALAARVGSLPNRGKAAIAELCGFDYVLLTGADAVPPLPVARFRLVAQSGFAALYAIEHCEEGP